MNTMILKRAAWSYCKLSVFVIGLGTLSGAAQTSFTVTSVGFSAYSINAANNPTLTLMRGVTYTFNVNASGHPFWIKTVSSTGTGNAYNTGVTGNGTQVGTLTFAVPANAPSTLFYNCQFHGAMAGTLNIISPPSPPSVAITNPPSGASFTAPATVTIQATASDSDGTVTNVQFFTNGVALGSDSTFPFSITASNLAVGSYTLTARATDNGGLITTSAPVSITVQAPNQPPTVAITNPIAGTVFIAPATFTIQAFASDPDGSVTNVQFLSGAASLGHITNSPYSLTVSNLAASTYNFTAKATDNSGLSATSAVVTVSVVTPGPIHFDNNLALLNGDLPLRVTVTPGLSYAMDYTTTFTNWLPFTNFVATNSVMSFSSPTTAGDHRFFRARLLPNP
jgi:hypothetical protein